MEKNIIRISEDKLYQIIQEGVVSGISKYTSLNAKNKTEDILNFLTRKLETSQDDNEKAALEAAIAAYERKRATFQDHVKTANSGVQARKDLADINRARMDRETFNNDIYPRRGKQSPSGYNNIELRNKFGY